MKQKEHFFWVQKKQHIMNNTNKYMNLLKVKYFVFTHIALMQEQMLSQDNLCQKRNTFFTSKETETLYASFVY